ncbi:MAG: acyltransferase family protein [Arenimonas sp.]
MTTRRHDIDALRALAFALLIGYHLCMLYVAEWDWHIKSADTFYWLQPLMIGLNRWRMDLIFLVSGLAASFLLKPGAAARFAWQRTLRLFVPLVFGMLVIVPAQPYVQGVSNGLVDPGFGAFLARYYTGASWPPGAFSGWEHGYTWNHLWYLAYLWIYTLVLALLARPLASRVGQKLRVAFTGLRGWQLLVLPAIPLFAYTVTLQPLFEDTGDFFHDWYRNAVYFTVFVYGFLIARDAGIWAEFVRLRRAALAIAAWVFLAYIVLVLWVPDDAAAPIQALVWGLRNLYIWTMLCAILGWSCHALNHPFRWLPWANDNVYPWYILHQSLIVLVAYWLIPLELHAGVEALLVLAGTVLGCWAITALVRRIDWLRPLFGLKRRTISPAKNAAPVLVGGA